MWGYGRIDLGTDYKHVALLRALQGLGIAPLFVPVSPLAYSFLPKNKNNKASSLTNLFRNQGGECWYRVRYNRSCATNAVSPVGAGCSRYSIATTLSGNAWRVVSIFCDAR